MAAQGDGPWIIGGAPACEVVLSDPRVSGQHMRLGCDQGRWWLQDLNSTNGTFVDGVRVQQAHLSDESRVMLGSSTYSLASLVALCREPVAVPHMAQQAPQIEHGPPQPPGPSAEAPVRELQVADTMLVVGRDAASCDVVLDEAGVSGQHARIFRNAGRLILEDLGSRNGTFVWRDGVWTSYRTLVLRTDDVVRIGTQCLRFRRAIGLPTSGVRLDVRGLFFTVPHRETGAPLSLLNNVSFSIMPGELVGIMGPSGSGKTTLLNVIAGFDTATSGQILLDAQALTGPHGRALGPLVGHAPQFDVAHERLTVAEAVEYSARLRGDISWDHTEIQARVYAALQMVGLEEKAATELGSESKKTLSGGQKKRVNIAMELVLDPPLLLLDEPTSGLSSHDTADLMLLLRRLADQGQTILLTIHQPSYGAFVQMDQLLLLEEGGHTAWFGPTAVDSFEYFSVSERSAGALLDRLPKKTGATAQQPGVWATRYRASEAYERFVLGRLRAPIQKKAFEHPRAQPLAVEQLGVLLSRALKLCTRDLFFIMLSIIAPAIIAGAAVAILRASLETGDGWSVGSAALEHKVMLVLTIMTCFFGALSSSLEIVNERAILRREQRGGTSLLAYVASKGLFFALPSVLFPLMAVSTVHLVGGALIQSSAADMLFVLIPTFFASACAGLLISALVPSAQTAIVMAVFFAVLQIIFSIFADLSEREHGGRWLSTVSAPMTARWALSGLVTTSDLCEDSDRGDASADGAKDEDEPTLEARAALKYFEAQCPTDFYTAHGVIPASDHKGRTSRRVRLRGVLVNLLLGVLALGVLAKRLRWRGTVTQ